VHPLLWLLFGFNIHKWIPSFIIRYSNNVTENSSPSLWYRSQEVKAKEFCFVHIHKHFWNPSGT
jgi:hypothetical protein